MASYRTPLGRARGLGSAGSGVGHFIGQRLSAAALIFLGAWALWSAIVVARGDYAAAVAWLRSPIDLGLATLFTVAAFYHMQVGMRVIVEDYFPQQGRRTLLLIASLFVCWGGAALSILCLMKVAFGGGGAF
ncbi:MAG TPA: succinate dehydrogenase, hydrophobic membrane anchor protein [Caulobacteraceae bacterium]